MRVCVCACVRVCVRMLTNESPDDRNLKMLVTAVCPCDGAECFNNCLFKIWTMVDKKCTLVAFIRNDHQRNYVKITRMFM